MFHAEIYSGDRNKDYEMVIKQLDALLEGESNIIANLANASALLNQFLQNVNWVGFYLYEEDHNELVLGPFQGLPACVRIPLGKGVCGTAFSEKKTLRVSNVQEFPGHITCDGASKSEIVVPIIKGGKGIGVLDIDSPIESRFDETDQNYLEQFVHTLVFHL